MIALIYKHLHGFVIVICYCYCMDYLWPTSLLDGQRFDACSCHLCCSYYGFVIVICYCMGYLWSTSVSHGQQFDSIFVVVITLEIYVD